MGKDKKASNAERQLAAYVVFILVSGVILYCVAMKLFYKPQTNNTPTGTQATETGQIQYEQVNLQDMLDELNANALRAEETYQDKCIEITGEIISFDSDGKYISIVPCGGSVWSEWVKCNLTDTSHKTFLLEKSVGDVVTIRGKVVSIGEILGYSVKIAEISN